jgi:hypothetical protein
MHFNVFSEDFLNKWLTPNDLENYNSLNDKKIKAGMNWLTAINTSSFKRYDAMWEKLKEKCTECMDKNCQEDYDWIRNNSELIKDDESPFHKLNEGYTRIKFANKEIGKEGIERVKNYHVCKKKCYEKINLMNSILSRKYSNFSYDFSVCFVLCRGKPIDKENILSDCYSDCMIKFSYHLPQIEYYITTIFEQMMKEYEKNMLATPKADLMHPYRFREREFTPDLWNKYL